MTPTLQQVFGLDPSQLLDHRGVLLHPSVVPAVLALERACAAQGFQLGIASAHRSFERQLHIWNGKAAGQRPLLGSQGEPLVRAELTDQETLWAILRWSAVPGGSRHHWGTDLDVFDARCQAQGYQVQLTQAEAEAGGVFADFHTWLSDYLQANPGFFRPYVTPEGGVAPEPWHLSWAPVARAHQQVLAPGPLRELLQNSDIALKTLLVRHFDEIYARFVWVPWHLYPEE